MLSYVTNVTSHLVCIISKCYLTWIWFVFRCQPRHFLRKCKLDLKTFPKEERERRCRRRCCCSSGCWQPTTFWSDSPTKDSFSSAQIGLRDLPEIGENEREIFGRRMLKVKDIYQIKNCQIIGWNFKTIAKWNQKKFQMRSEVGLPNTEIELTP